MERIFLEPDEEIISAIDRLHMTSRDEVVFVIPRGSSIIQSALNLKLLRKEAEDLGKRVSLAVEDKKGRAIARVAGLAVEDDSGADFYTEDMKESFDVESLDIKKGDTDDSSVKMQEIGSPRLAAKKDDSPLSLVDIVPSKLSRAAGAQGSQKSQFRKKKETSKNKKTSLKQKKTTAPKSKTGSGIPKSRSDFFAKLRKDVLGQAKESKKSPPSRPKKIKRGHWSDKLIWIFAGLSIILAVAVAFLVTSEAELVVLREETPVDTEKEVTLNVKSSSDEFLENELAMEIISINKITSEEFVATGKENVNAKARGEVTIFNELSQNQPMIPSRFQLPDGRIYWSVTNIIIPANGSTKVDVVAEKAGEDYNADCSEENLCSFTIPAWKGTSRFSKITAKATAPINGGSQGESLIVEQTDIDVGREVIKNKINRELNQELKSKIPSGVVALEDAFRVSINNIESSKRAGEIGEKFEITAEGKGEVVVFKEADLLDIFARELEKSSGLPMEIVPKKRQIQYRDLVVDWEDRTAVLVVSVSGIAKRELKEEVVLDNITGQTEQETREYFENLDGISQVRIKLFPFWLNNFPADRRKIQLSID